MRIASLVTALVLAPAALGDTLQCGDQRIAINVDRDGLRLTVGAESFDMRPVASASGAKYEAVDDPTTTFWSKGERALLEVRGQAYPECQPVAEPPFRASGNEPFWSLEITDAELTLVTQLGERRLTVPLPAPETVEGLTRYRTDAEGRALEVRIADRICADTMTGMPRPRTVVVVLDGEELAGCGGDPASLLQGDEWSVYEIGGQPIVDGSKVTLAFSADGRVSGAGSCNRFMGSYTLTGEGLTLSQMASTMMACEEGLMDQEGRYLRALEAVSRFDLDADGQLVLHTVEGETVRARRP